jgi:hypothetical protein
MQLVARFQMAFLRVVKKNIAQFAMKRLTRKILIVTDKRGKIVFKECCFREEPDQLLDRRS